jgi:hypothetical protein
MTGRFVSKLNPNPSQHVDVTESNCSAAYFDDKYATRKLRGRGTESQGYLDAQRRRERHRGHNGRARRIVVIRPRMLVRFR